MVENKSDYIGKTCRHNDGEEDILKDIYIEGKDKMIWFIMENESHSCSGIEEIVSIYDREKGVDVNIRYCGSFLILKGV
jgi:hypothetical protein